MYTPSRRRVGCHGVVVREVQLLPEGVLDYEDLAKKINERTRILAVGLASNVIGTVNDLQRIRKMSYEVGALLVVDAVHYAPHFPIEHLVGTIQSGNH